MKETCGFLLTRQWQDTPQGLSLRFWISTHHGPLLIEQTDQEGVFFVENKFFQQAILRVKSLVKHTRQLTLKSFSQEAVSAFYFSSQHNLKRAATLLQESGIPPLEADVRTVDRYLMERFITGAITVSSNIDTQPDNFLFAQNCKLSSCEYSPQLKVVSFDIETNIHSQKLLSIAVVTQSSESVFIIGSRLDKINNAEIFQNERALIIRFMDWLHDYDPDILIGWNCINFDLRVLEKACQRLKLQFNIGRNNEAVQWRTSPNNEGHYLVFIPGRAVLDGIDTLKSATYSFESFSLEFVSRELLGKGKLIHDPDDRGEEILRLFHQDKPSLAIYNLEDCKLVWEIFEQADLFQFVIERARLTGLPIDKVGGSVAAFENQYLPRLHRQGYVAPNLPIDPQGVGSPGGYVMDSQPGLYENVLVLDFKSLYPSIIRSFKIDPYGLAEGDRIQTQGLTEELKDLSQFSEGFRGAFFKIQDSILPSLIEHLWLARDKAKKAQQSALSQAIKIIMNSFYGVMGTPGCRFFDPRLPSSITLRGHSIMNQTRTLIEQAGYQVIYGDTDSIFVFLNKVVTRKEADYIGVYLADKITSWWKEHLKQDFKLESALELEYESHFSRFVMPTIRGSEKGSKKRYAGMTITHDFTYEKPNKNNFKLVFKGLETVRTDWTHLAREIQKELYQRIFLNQEYKAYILQIVKSLKQGELDDKLIYRKRLRRKLREYQKNVPPHVQAARKADAWLISNHKKTRYQHGGWIAYCYTVNGPEPLECLSSTLDYEVYIERQIAPVVDGIVNFLGTSFEEINSGQMTLGL